MKDKIDKWAFSTFKDRDAAEWASRWLCLFFASESPVEVMAGISQMFTGFGGNLFYLKNQNLLYPLCAHAIQSYSESAASISVDGQSEWTASGVMQSLEPVIMAGRLMGINTVRKELFSLLKD